MEINNIIIGGNLTKAPEMNKTNNTGTPVTTFTVANNRKFRKKDSEETQQETCFVDVTVWGKQGEICTEYLDKGSRVLIDGRLKQDTWEDKNTGDKRSKLAIVANKVHFVGQYGKKTEHEPHEEYDNQVTF